MRSFFYTLGCLRFSYAAPSLINRMTHSTLLRTATKFIVYHTRSQTPQSKSGTHNDRVSDLVGGLQRIRKISRSLRRGNLQEE